MRKSLLFLFLAFPLWAQQQTPSLATTSLKPAADGVVSKGEYPVSLEAAGISVALARSADALSIAVSAPTQGWVAVGLGSRRMDGAAIFIGYVAGGKPELKVQSGREHGHGDAASDALLASAAKEEGGRTTLELVLKSSAFIQKGQAELALILAFGRADAFTSMHAARSTLTVKLTD